MRVCSWCVSVCVRVCMYVCMCVCLCVCKFVDSEKNYDLSTEKCIAFIVLLLYAISLIPF